MVDSISMTTRDVPKNLTYCDTDAERLAWAIRHMKQGGRLFEVSLWLGGISKPIRFVGAVKRLLQTEGIRVVSRMETARDAAGENHPVLAWRIAKEVVRNQSPP